MRPTTVDIIVRNNGVCRIPDETLIQEAKTLGAIVTNHPHLMPAYIDYTHHMRNGDSALARVAKMFIVSWQNV